MQKLLLCRRLYQVVYNKKVKPINDLTTAIFRSAIKVLILGNTLATMLESPFILNALKCNPALIYRLIHVILSCSNQSHKNNIRDSHAFKMERIIGLYLAIDRFHSRLNTRNSDCSKYSIASRSRDWY